MSKKEEKSGKLNEMLEHLVDESLASPLLTQEQMDEYIDTLWDNLLNGVEGCTYIGFDDHSPSLPQNTHHLTGEAVVMLHRMTADNPIWLHSGKDTSIEAYAIIGKDGKPETNPKTRAFWKGKIEEFAPYISELERLYVAVIANDTCLHGNADKGYQDNREYDAMKDYALLTWFTNGELFHISLTETPDVNTVKSFILRIWV